MTRFLKSIFRPFDTKFDLITDYIIRQKSMAKLVLFDYSREIADAFQEYFGSYPDIQIYHGDVRYLKDIDIYVSPANSQGYMDGGIDAIYMEMFPGIEDTVRKAIKHKSPCKTVYDRRVLPVGSALIVDIPMNDKKPKKGKIPKLICAPTMFMPSNIEKESMNVYYAMMAILKITKHYPGKTVAISGLGTGVGGISPQTCAHLMLLAYNDFMDKRPYQYPIGSKVIQDTPEIFLTEIKDPKANMGQVKKIVIKTE